MSVNSIIKTASLILLLATGWMLPSPALATQKADATAIIKAAMDQWRGSTSHATMSMTIHRPEWQRTMTMEAWTAGDKKSLMRVLKPKKDAGSGTLLLGNKMWTFLPKINRVIKIPASMMNQNWMGSDFSNKDIARSADIIDQYTHSLINTTVRDGHTIYTIQSIPKEDAPVVWGKEVLLIRDDFVMLEHTFYDQDMKPVKQMRALKIGKLGGRVVALRERMSKFETPGEWTEVNVISITFNANIPASTFTQSNLRNPRH